jgi:hypothetical protein
MDLVLFDENCGATDFVVKQAQQEESMIIHDRPSMTVPGNDQTCARRAEFLAELVFP